MPDDVPVVKIGTLRLVKDAPPEPKADSLNAFGGALLCILCIGGLSLIALTVGVVVTHYGPLPLVLLVLAVVTIVPFLFRERPPYCTAGLRRCASPRCGCLHDRG